MWWSLRASGLAILLLCAFPGAWAAEPVAPRSDARSYAAGVLAFDEGRLPDALAALQAVSPLSPDYIRALYLMGVLHNRQGKLKSAVPCFRDAYRAAPLASGRDAHAAEERIRDLALLDIARIYYGLERFSEAARYDSLVPADSPLFARAAFERGWAHFMTNELDLLEQDLDVLEGPAGKNLYLPEAEWLAALRLFNDLWPVAEHDPGVLIARIDSFQRRWGPVRSALAALVSQHGAEPGQRAPAELYRRWVVKSKPIPGLPAPLIEELRSNPAVIADPTGAVLLERLRWRAGELEWLWDQMRVLRFEVADIPQLATPRPTLAALARELVEDPPAGVDLDELKERFALCLDQDDPERRAVLEAVLATTSDRFLARSARYELAADAFEAGDRDRAAALLGVIVAEWPDWPEPWLLVGELRFEANDMAGAIDAYAVVLADLKDPQRDYAMYKTAWARLALDEVEAGLAGLAQVAASGTVSPALRQAAMAERTRLMAPAALRVP